MTRPLFLMALIAAGNAVAAVWFVDDRIAPIFADADLNGVFVLLDREGDRLLTNDIERARKPFLPASTFKILNSLISLEEGVIADENVVFPWDGIDREVKGWNRDHTLESAFKGSAVWYYQELARRIGRERMAYWVGQSGFGNTDIAGNIDTFWLDGALRITAEEQLLFLERFREGKLPFARRIQDIVLRIMVAEDAPTHVIRAKSGWALRGAGPIGWYVGWVERDGRVYYFALNCDLPQERDGRVRIQVVRAVLRMLSILPAE